MGNNESSVSGYPALHRNYSTLNFLTKPITELHGHHGSNEELHYGMTCVQGWRAHMEDAHIMCTDLPGLTGWSFFSVLDGHAGRMCAEVSEKTLVPSVLFEVLPVRDSLTGVMDAMKRAFIRHDRDLSANFEMLRSRSGTTCTSILVTPTHAVFCNLGDSRAVLARGGKPIFASVDHKPSLPAEAKRIRAAGGAVIMDRVDGGLAVSRAFGDFDYKMRTDLPAIAQKVSPEPDTYAVPLANDGDEFLLLACDGVWDVMSTMGAVKYAHTVLQKHGADQAGARAASEAIVQRCLQLGSRDNISAVVVVLHARVAPAPEPFEEMVDRLAASVACNAVVSAVQRVVLFRGTSVLPPAHVRSSMLDGAVAMAADEPVVRADDPLFAPPSPPPELAPPPLTGFVRSPMPQSVQGFTMSGPPSMPSIDESVTDENDIAEPE